MSSLTFLDTNVLLLAAGMHPAHKRETALAREIVRQEDCAVSVQVLGEFYAQSTRTSRSARLSREDAADWLSVWRRWPVQPNDESILDAALEVARRTNYHYYDCAIIAAAQALRCDLLLSRDMHHGHVIDGLRIENPFLPGEAA